MVVLILGYALTYVDSWSRRNDRHNGLFKYSSNLDTGSQQLAKSKNFVQKPIVKVVLFMAMQCALCFVMIPFYSFTNSTRMNFIFTKFQKRSFKCGESEVKYRNILFQKPKKLMQWKIYCKNLSLCTLEKRPVFALLLL